MLIDPVNAWYIRNTGDPLTPVPTVQNAPYRTYYGPEVPDSRDRTRPPKGWERREEQREQRAKTYRDSVLRADPQRSEGLPQDTTAYPSNWGLNPYRDRPGMGAGRKVTGPNTDESNRASARDARRAEAAKRQAQRAAELRAQRQERQAQARRRLEQRQAQARQRVERRLQAKIVERQRRIAFQTAQQRSFKRDLATGRVIPVDTQSALDKIFTRRTQGNLSGGKAPRSMITPKDMQKSYGGFYEDTQVNPQFGYRPGRPIRDPGGPTGGRSSRDQYFGKTREVITYGRPLYSEGAQWGYGLGKSRKEISNIQAKLINIGVLDPRATQRGVWDYNTAKAMEAIMGEVNVIGETVEAALARMPGEAALSSSYAGGGGGGGAGGPLSTTETTKVYDITSLDSGAATLRQVLAQQLGRWPTQAEIKNYVAQLNAKERANPDIITVTAKSNASGSITTSSRVTEGKRPDAEEEGLRFSQQGKMGEEREDFMEGRYYEELASLIGLE